MSSCKSNEHARARIDDQGNAKAIACPRCGYDQRGVVAAWTDSCPIAGQCSECGLGFAWGNVFGNRLREPRWCVEFGSIITFPFRLIGTLLMSCWPWRFWRTLQLQHEIRWGRIAAYLLMIAMLMYFVFAANISSSIYLEWGAIDAQIQESSRTVAVVSENIRKNMLLKGRPAERYILKRRPSGALLAAHAFLLPLTETIIVEYEFIDNSMMYQTYLPKQRANELIERVLIRLRGNHYTLTKSILFPFALLLLMPILFALVPRSLRVAKVRAAHLLRISMYSLALPFVATAFGLNEMLQTTASPSFGIELMWQSIGLISFVALPIIAILWWSVAISKYLRMHAPWRLAIALTTVGWLLLMVLGYFTLILRANVDWLI